MCTEPPADLQGALAASHGFDREQRRDSGRRQPWTKESPACPSGSSWSTGIFWGKEPARCLPARLGSARLPRDALQGAGGRAGRRARLRSPGRGLWLPPPPQDLCVFLQAGLSVPVHVQAQKRHEEGREQGKRKFSGAARISRRGFAPRSIPAAGACHCPQGGGGGRRDTCFAFGRRAPTARLLRVLLPRRHTSCRTG